MILYHQAARISAPRLANYMGIESKQRLEDRPEWLIRYGSARRVPYRPKRAVINPRLSLASLSTRYEQLMKFREARVPTPEFTRVAASIEWPEYLGRREASGRQTTKGRGITHYTQGDSPSLKDDFFVQYIPKDRQFRVHVILGNARVREVVPDDEPHRSQPVWNLGTGFTYRIAHDTPPTVVPVAQAAVSALRLHFGAVDIITHKEAPKTAYVLEVNTAPGLSDPTLEWYARHLGRGIGLLEDDMPKWDAAERLEDEA